jgi:serine protease Do
MKLTFRKILLMSVLVAVCSGLIGATTAAWFFKNQSEKGIDQDNVAHFMSGDYHSMPGYIEQNMEKATRLTDDVDFVFASQKSTSSVVFIQTLSEYEFRTGGWLDWFFEPQGSKQTSSGSGVILSKDGYIVTNNHVIDGADVIRVVHGKQTYVAELIGKDPSSDLAVIKIIGDNLPAIEVGDSDDVKVGQWVLAVGNPFNLTSTVTGGIVIESFIQTDAAINPGNSGGALVDMDGILIGINTAILSRTGSYTGYGFAIPANIVKKVFKDIKNYGEVQKTFTGADFLDIDSDLAEKLNLSDLSGVLISNTTKEGAADKANLKKGDVIKTLDDKKVESKASLEEHLANLYPGDKINLLIERDGKELTKNMTLTNREGTTGIIRREIHESAKLNATFEAVSKVEKDLLGIESGVKVLDYKNIGFFSKLGIPEGFIITKINNTQIDKPEELAEILENISGRVIISGIDNRGRKVYYPYYF